MSSIFIDFRATSGYVTDPTGATYCLGGGSGADQYPITRGGVTFGWTDGIDFGASADRDSGNVAQLAGINYVQNTPGVTNPFQLDLAALGGPGTYKIGIALGDATANNGIQHAVVKDGSTTLFTVDGTMSAINTFIDATSVERSNTAWLGSQGYQTVTVAGSSLTVLTGDSGPSTSGFTCLACLYVEFVPTATALPVLPHRFQTFPRRRGR